MTRGLPGGTRLLQPGQTLTHLPLSALVREIHGAKDHAHNRHRHGQQEQNTQIDTPRQCVIPFDTDRMGPGSHWEYGENRRSPTRRRPLWSLYRPCMRCSFRQARETSQDTAGQRPPTYDHDVPPTPVHRVAVER